MRGLVRISSHDLKALLITFAVGATDQGFIPDAIKAAQGIGYTVIRFEIRIHYQFPTDITLELQRGS